MKALEKEEAEMQELVRQKQDYQILTAAQKKEARLLEESMVCFHTEPLKMLS